MIIKYARNAILAGLSLLGMGLSFPASAAEPEGRHFVLEGRSPLFPQQLGKDDTLELRGVTGDFFRRESGCYWLIDTLNSLTLDPLTHLVYTFTAEQRPCFVRVEGVKNLINNGTIVLQGIRTYQMHGEPPSGREARSVEVEASGRIAFTGVAYSGSGSFILPIGKKTSGAIEFVEGQIDAPVRLTLLPAQPLSVWPQSSVVWMQNVTFGKGIDPDNAVILTNSEIEGIRLKLVHETKTLENAGRKHVFHTWSIESIPESAPAGQR